MEVGNRRGLKAAARKAMAAAQYSPKKLILIHTGITVLSALLLYLVTGMLQVQIEGTGGLGGAPMRVMLSTAITVLQMLYSLVLPFWQIGFLFASIQIVRGRSAGPDSLKEGFRQAWPVLKTQLLVMLFAAGMVFACYYAGYTVYLMTPLSKDLMVAMMGTDMDALMAAMEEAILPIMLFMLPPLLVVGTWFSYRMRLVDYVLMDDPNAGAMATIRKCWKLTKGKFGKLVKLDLSFWWFYVLQLLLLAVAYADVLLPLIGIELPWPELALTYVPLVVYQLLSLLLYWWRGSYVQVTYACFYEAALPKEPENAE